MELTPSTDANGNKTYTVTEWVRNESVSGETAKTITYKVDENNNLVVASVVETSTSGMDAQLLFGINMDTTTNKTSSESKTYNQAIINTDF